MYGHCPLINLSQRGAESNSHLRSPNQSQSLLLSPPFVGLAVGFGLNARGAMEIILGTLALNAGLIDEKMFVALVIMALITSLMSGPLMKKFIEQ